MMKKRIAQIVGYLAVMVLIILVCSFALSFLLKKYQCPEVCSKKICTDTILSNANNK